VQFYKEIRRSRHQAATQAIAATGALLYGARAHQPVLRSWA